MPFAAGTVFTNSGKRTAADRMQTTPTRNPLKYIAAGTGATAATRTAAATDTALSTELGEGRVLGTEAISTVTNTNDTYGTSGTITATGTRTVDEAGTFDQLAAGGNMGISATISPTIGLVTNDQLTLTMKVQFT